jgi:N-acetylglucosaminyldiphosphoundecaprenol N-acetyl-beta-D-mannosaminyltransferase
MQALASGTADSPKPAVSARGVADFLGIKLDAISYSELFDLVDQWIADKGARSHHVACVNAFCVALAQEDDRLRRIYNSADVTGPDGMPFVRWIQWIKRAPTDRIAAPDTISALAAESMSRGYTFYLYGGDEAMAVGMKDYLERQFPGIRIVGFRSPPFRPLTEEEDAAICAEINSLKPDIICVGLGTPKQDYWIEDHLYRVRGAVMIASGATFDFFGGRVALAPEWVRRSGFEWLFRLAGRDFKRLWRRYTVYNARFLTGFLLQLVGLRRPIGERLTRPYD